MAYERIVIGLTGLIWFLIPYKTKRIMNIGNATGCIISMVLILSGIIDRQLRQLICDMEIPSPAFYLLIAVLIMLFLALTLALRIFLCMHFAAGRRPAKNATLIILGCRVYGDRPSLMLEERLTAALKYWLDNPSSSIIVAGGKGDDEDISEAQCMYDWLISAGIPSEIIYREDKSTSTLENIIFSLDIIEKYSLNRQLAIVSNEFHLYRAMEILRNCDEDAVYGAVPAHTAWWLYPTYMIREMYAILAMWLKIHNRR